MNFRPLQLALGIPLLQVWIHVEFRVCDDLVAEAVNDHGDGVDTPQAFVEALLGRRFTLLLLACLQYPVEPFSGCRVGAC